MSAAVTGERVDCPICEADDGDPWGLEYQGHRIVRCRRCGLRYLNPRRSAEENRRVYGDHYFERHRARERDPEGSDLVRERDAASIEAILRFCPVPRPSLLDVGAGTGSFLRLAREGGRFGRLAGADLSSANEEAFARAAIPLRVGPLEDLDLAPFDVVAAHHVLEHVLDPNRFLVEVRRLLVDEGILHLLVPNEGSLTSRSKSFWSKVGLKPRPFRHLSPGHHLTFFERGTLTRLLDKHDFRPLGIRTRADAKRRDPWQRLVHRVFDALGWNTWLEVVARKGTS
ncbi:MAG: class I SAM-dependent methyltransferase [Gemmatimonadota bacterium]